ncbi:MAG: hypothetical protein ABFS56_06370 [Pseudomonadota bacterium]
MPHQEVSGHWAIKLDGSDAPPVLIDLDYFHDLLWEVYAYHFSEFIYELCWDFIRKKKK